MGTTWIHTLAPYVTWLCLALVLAAIGQVVKRVALQSGLAHWRWFWASLPLHPVLVGGVLGASKALPLPEGAGTTALAGAVYYAASGICCTWIYDLARSWMKAHRAVKP